MHAHTTRDVTNSTDHFPGGAAGHSGHMIGTLYVRDPVETIRSNFQRPTQVVDACARHGKWLIVYSTCEVYGRTISSYVGDEYGEEVLSHPIEDVPSENFYGKGYEDSDRRVPDISKAQRLLGSQPRYGIDETLQLAVEFFMEFESNRERALRSTI